MINRLRSTSQEFRSGRPLLTPNERAWLGFILFTALVVLLDRLTNLVHEFRMLNGLIYLFAIFGLGWWAGIRSALASCVVLVAYAWLVYHFYPISYAARDPKLITAATVMTAVFYPPFAIAGGVIHHILKRAAKRVSDAQAELWASEEMRSLIVDSSVDAVIGIAPDRTVTLWSPNAEKLFGWKRSEAIGSPAASLIIAPSPIGSGPNDLLLALESDRQLLLRRRVETTALTKFGEEIEVELYMADHRTEAGTMYVLFARDISERKRAEQLIRELNTSLEERVAERTQQLKDANEELLGFTYSVSHDLRAPLRAIVSNSRLAREEARHGVSEETASRLQRLETSALRMAELIDNLLQYARIGRAKLVSINVDISAIASRIGAELQTTREGTFKVEPGIVVRGDPQMIEIVLFNLIENAWKYVRPDTIPDVEVGISEDGAVFVRDHGIGFDMRYADKVWEPFERLHNESEYPGTGIGLANSKRIVDRHGGKMWAESVPGSGTTMYFDLGPNSQAHPEKRSRRSQVKAL